MGGVSSGEKYQGSGRAQLTQARAVAGGSSHRAYILTAEAERSRHPTLLPTRDRASTSSPRPARPMSGQQQQEHNVQMQEQMQMQVQRVCPTVWEPDSQTTTRVRAGSQEPGTRSHKRQSKPLSHTESHANSPSSSTQPTRATLRPWRPDNSAATVAAAAPPRFPGPPARRGRADIVEIPRAHFLRFPPSAPSHLGSTNMLSSGPGRLDHLGSPSPVRQARQTTRNRLVRAACKSKATLCNLGPCSNSLSEEGTGVQHWAQA